MKSEATMKILTPQWSLRRFDRYLPLMRSISERVDGFHVVYAEREPEKEWQNYFHFHKMTMPFSFVKSTTARLYLSRGKMFSQIKDVNVDVIFCLSELWMQEFSRYCSSRMKVPYAVWLRGNHREFRRAMNVNRVKKALLNYLETRSLKSANLVIPNSLELAEKAEEWGVEKRKITSPVYSGVDTEMFRPMDVERSNQFTIGYSGRISPEKRIAELLRVAEKLTDVHFIVAGIKQMEVTLPSNVEYLGEISFAEMPRFYNRIDLVVLPSVTEGFPGVILEAYACGIPVLVTKEALPKELKLFGSIASIDQFDSEIRTLKKSDLKTLGQAARSYVKEHFTWDQFGESIFRYLKDVTERVV